MRFRSPVLLASTSALLACLCTAVIAAPAPLAPPTTITSSAATDGPLPPADDGAPAELATVAVTGVQPGPGLWRVSKGDHVLWIVGTLSPVPEKVTWRSAELEQRLAEAQAIVGSPGFSLSTGRGIFGNLLLVPSMLGARKNPDKATLQDVLSPELYARWTKLKATYLGRGRGIERWRPIFAAQKLHRKAVEKSGLRFGSPAAALVSKTAKERELPWVEAIVEFKLDDPRGAIRDFKAQALDDTECFARTLQRLETDLGLLGARADAWSTGDLERLRELRDSDPASACIEALLGADLLRERGLVDVRARAQAAWIAAVEKALAEHEVSIGMLSIDELLKPDGYLAELSARGYAVVAPDAEDFADEQEMALTTQ